MKTFLIFVYTILEITADGINLIDNPELANISNIETINHNLNLILESIEADFDEDECIPDHGECGIGTKFVCSNGPGECSDQSENIELGTYGP